MLSQILSDIFKQLFKQNIVLNESDKCFTEWNSLNFQTYKFSIFPSFQFRFEKIPWKLHKFKGIFKRFFISSYHSEYKGVVVPSIKHSSSIFLSNAQKSNKLLGFKRETRDLVGNTYCFWTQTKRGKENTISWYCGLNDARMTNGTFTLNQNKDVVDTVEIMGPLGMYFVTDD